MKELFEAFLIAQFGNEVKSLLDDFDDEDGYQDELINAMWIGFNGGYKLANPSSNRDEP